VVDARSHAAGFRGSPTATFDRAWAACGFLSYTVEPKGQCGFVVLDSATHRAGEQLCRASNASGVDPFAARICELICICVGNRYLEALCQAAIRSSLDEQNWWQFPGGIRSGRAVSQTPNCLKICAKLAFFGQCSGPDRRSLKSNDTKASPCRHQQRLFPATVIGLRQASPPDYLIKRHKPEASPSRRRAPVSLAQVLFARRCLFRFEGAATGYPP